MKNRHNHLARRASLWRLKEPIPKPRNQPNELHLPHRPLPIRSFKIISQYFCKQTGDPKNREEIARDPLRTAWIKVCLPPLEKKVFLQKEKCFLIFSITGFQKDRPRITPSKEEVRRREMTPSQPTREVQEESLSGQQLTPKIELLPQLILRLEIASKGKKELRFINWIHNYQNYLMFWTIFWFPLNR